MLEEEFTKSEVVDNHSSKVKQDDEHSVKTIFKPLKWSFNLNIHAYLSCQSVLQCKPYADAWNKANSWLFAPSCLRSTGASII